MWVFEYHVLYSSSRSGIAGRDGTNMMPFGMGSSSVRGDAGVTLNLVAIPRQGDVVLVAHGSRR